MDGGRGAGRGDSEVVEIVTARLLGWGKLLCTGTLPFDIKAGACMYFDGQEVNEYNFYGSTPVYIHADTKAGERVNLWER